MDKKSFDIVLDEIRKVPFIFTEQYKLSVLKGGSGDQCG